MDVAIVGASGSMGRQIAIGLLRERVLSPSARLQLVGRKDGASGQMLAGVAEDLRDAFDEMLPELDLAYRPEDVLADVVVLALGETMPRGARVGREALAERNVPLVERYARALARHGHGEELVFVLTNPVEPCVAAACKHLDRRRVIGLGAYLDTLRFRREVARSLGVTRERVQGLVLGEHGLRMVPCFSTVSVHGLDHPAGRARLRELASARGPSAAEAIARVHTLLGERGATAAYAYVARLGPGLRTVVAPYVTQLCGARTPAGTSEMVVRLLSTLLAGGRVFAAAQVALAGELLGLHGVAGAPVVLSLRGVEQVVPYDLDPDERARVIASVTPLPPRTRRRRAAPAAPDTRVAPRRLRVVLARSEVGTAERVATIFTERGINIEALRSEGAPVAALTVAFSAPDNVVAYLVRRLRRLARVTAVQLLEGTRARTPTKLSRARRVGRTARR
jgi:malate dehydrogenase